MEADLGIDSIKRVEILGELQDAGIVPAADMDLDRLASAGRSVRSSTCSKGRRRPSVSRGDVALAGSIRASRARSLAGGRSLARRARRPGGGAPHTRRPPGLGDRPDAARACRSCRSPSWPRCWRRRPRCSCPGGGRRRCATSRRTSWIRYEDEPVALEIRARRDPAGPTRSASRSTTRGTARAHRERRRRAGRRGASSSSAIAARPARSPAPFDLEDARPLPVHGRGDLPRPVALPRPGAAAVRRIGRSSPHGIEGTLRVLPRAGLLRDRRIRLELHDRPDRARRLHPPARLLGARQVRRRGRRDLPAPAGRADDLRRRPARGGRGRVPDRGPRGRAAPGEGRRRAGRAPTAGSGCGSTAGRTGGSTGRAATATTSGMPDRVFVGEPLELPGDPTQATVRAVWLEPPADMGKPVWRDVLEWVQLGPERTRRVPGERRPEARATLRLWGRIAAKEAARRLWVDEASRPSIPADLAIEPDEPAGPGSARCSSPTGPTCPPSRSRTPRASPSPWPRSTRRPGSGSTSSGSSTARPGFEAVAFQTAERACSTASPTSDGDAPSGSPGFWCAQGGRGQGDRPRAGRRAGERDGRGGRHRDRRGRRRARPRARRGLPGLADVRSASHRAPGRYAWAWTLARGVDP